MHHSLQPRVCYTIFKKAGCRLLLPARLKSTDSFQPPTRPMAPKQPKNVEAQKKLREKTPIGKLDELPEGQHPHQEKEPLPAWPNNTNPNTGEIGGPRGPEPTRYGDWERKGKVSDF